MTLFALTNKDTNRVTYIHHFETLLNKRKKVRDFLYLCQMMASHIIHNNNNSLILVVRKFHVHMIKCA